jgi:hypothetical protein
MYTLYQPGWAGLQCQYRQTCWETRSWRRATGWDEQVDEAKGVVGNPRSLGLLASAHTSHFPLRLTPVDRYFKWVPILHFLLRPDVRTLASLFISSRRFAFGNNRNFNAADKCYKPLAPYWETKYKNQHDSPKSQMLIHVSGQSIMVRRPALHERTAEHYEKREETVHLLH